MLWIDISNAPHVHFFKSLISKLPPEDLLITARNFGPIPELLKRHNIDAKLVGRHGGADKRAKLSESTSRVGKLTDLVSGQDITSCLYKYSVEAARVAFGLDIPITAVADNEFAHHQNLLTVPFAGRALTPAVTPLTCITGEHLTFNGVCEVANIDGFSPDPKVLDSLHISTDKPIAIVRPEPYLAAYSEKTDLDQ